MGWKKCPGHLGQLHCIMQLKKHVAGPWLSDAQQQRGGSGWGVAPRPMTPIQWNPVARRMHGKTHGGDEMQVSGAQWGLALPLPFGRPVSPVPCSLFLCGSYFLLPDLSILRRVWQKSILVTLSTTNKQTEAGDLLGIRAYRISSGWAYVAQ